MVFRRLLRKRRNKKSEALIGSILKDETALALYRTRVHDSMMINEGNVQLVMNDVAMYISTDFNEYDKKVCFQVSSALVTLIRLSMNRFDSLECRYIR